jgi:hypothetical protein
MLITSVTLIIAVGVIVDLTLTSTTLGPSTTVTLPVTSGTQPAPYPIGIPNTAESSGMAPPSATAIPGYTLTYSNNFEGTKIPAGWTVYHGTPMGDPGAQFGTAHVVVGDGELRLNTWRDPRYQNRWVTGGLCQCGKPAKYGAFFVRSRDTGGGASEIQLLWPASNVWPPEIDFNESAGRLNSTSASDHFGPTNQLDQRELRINMTQWHTWGVVWSPKSIEYVVDGIVWATVTDPSEIPTVPMTLDLQQQTWCSEDRLCPQKPVSMLIDWVAEYKST